MNLIFGLPLAVTATVSVAGLLVLMITTPTAAVKGRQYPNTILKVPQPTVSCNCEIIKRTVNITPMECLDYCIWRWAWY